MDIFLDQQIFNPLTPGTFRKKCVFWTFWWFLNWISTKLPLIWLKMHLQHSSLPFLPPASHFSALWLGHAQKSKFWVTYVFRLFDLWIFFFAFPFSPFLFFFAAVTDLLLGLLAVKKLLRKCHRDGQFWHGAARCNGRKFCSEFFTQRFEHFCANVRLHWADHSDLGIIGKIFSSCRSWV